MADSIHPFPYDPFQQRAIDVIDAGCSLFVAAPTGSGKTVLADYAIEHSLARGHRVIYTAPIKALSNQKFRDFSARHGGDQVGILTGDVTINPTAPLIIMTTEIYRNTLLENVDRFSGYAWVIFDEIHYLDDPERGTVWEEAILFTPPHINLLCLSATIPNVEELASWIREVHERPVEVIVETHRPVPLSVLFQCQNEILRDEASLKRVGYSGHDDVRRFRHRSRYGYGRQQRIFARSNRLDTLVRDLQEHDRLPCIFFTFGRRRAEEIAAELSGFSLIEGKERGALSALFTQLCELYQVTDDKTAQVLSGLVDRGIGFHHAGMLPTMKEVMERCFVSRMMKLIVTTETFALGVNMPARSVVLDSIKKRADSGFEPLRRRQFMQMAGRAGRRGMDDAGFVYVRVNPQHASYPELAQVLHGQPEPVMSRFNTTYATLLNLYRQHGRRLLEIFPKTLYYAQSNGARRQQGLGLMERKLDLLAAMGYVGRKALTPKGEFGSWVYGYELLLTELYTAGALSGLDVTSLVILMTAVVYEPRPNTLPPRPHPVAKGLAKLCRESIHDIHKEEVKWRVGPKTKAPAYHLAHAIEAWIHQAKFEQILKLCDVDEGELVRYFRMTVQLLRQLSEIPTGDPQLRATAEKAMRKINRDVIDAEAQLRLG